MRTPFALHCGFVLAVMPALLAAATVGYSRSDSFSISGDSSIFLTTEVPAFSSSLGTLNRVDFTLDVNASLVELPYCPYEEECIPVQTPLGVGLYAYDADGSTQLIDSYTWGSDTFTGFRMDPVFTRTGPVALDIVLSWHADGGWGSGSTGLTIQYDYTPAATSVPEPGTGVCVALAGLVLARLLRR